MTRLSLCYKGKQEAEGTASSQREALEKLQRQSLTWSLMEEPTLQMKHREIQAGDTEKQEWFRGQLFFSVQAGPLLRVRNRGAGRKGWRSSPRPDPVYETVTAVSLVGQLFLVGGGRKKAHCIYPKYSSTHSTNIH